MIQSAISIKLKNKMELSVRTPNSSEAQITIESMAVIAANSPYILSTPESFRAKNLDTQIKWLEESAQSDTSVIIAVYNQSGFIVGFCNARSYSDIKRKHRAALGISIHSEYRGHGLGKKLMEILIQNIKKFKDIKIIELDVMTENITAIKMYEKLGFKHGGIFPKAFLFQDEKFIDNLTMYLEVQ